jgi:glycosyltransferase involved in cell wall biosynthesis
MRILLTTDYYWPRIGGGVEVVVQQVAERLARRGHQVAVLTLNTQRAPRSEEVCGVGVRRVRGLELTRWLGMQLTLPLDLPGFASFVDSWKPEVVHAHNTFFLSTVLAILFRRRIPTVVTLHLGPVSDSMGRLVALYERVVSRRLLRAADQVTVVSALAAQAWPEATVIPNGVDTDVFRPLSSNGDQNFRVMFVGRLIANKGPQRLMEAIPSMDPGVTVVFVGDGPLRGTLEARARNLGVAHRVTFTGVLSDVHRVLPTASVLVRPCDTEGMSLAVLEALASGVPVIASEVSAGDLIEHGVNGFRLRDNSPDEIAGAVRQLHQSPDARRHEMAVAARRTAERFSWDKPVSEYEQVYAALVRGRRAA